MVGRSNAEQMHDLLKSLLGSGRPARFADYWESARSHPTESSDPPAAASRVISIMTRGEFSNRQLWLQGEFSNQPWFG